MENLQIWKLVTLGVAIVPLFKSNPEVDIPLYIADLNLVINSEESNPALSARIVGNCLKALANASTANDFLPSTFCAAVSTAFDIIISAHPPPNTVLVSLVVCDKTDNASCNERSASSKTCSVAPLKTIVHASPAAQPENLVITSSPMITSSIDLHEPNLTNSG
ncbi:hypothetical protein WICMUC_001115 [Wickerhamomyces mucosus]|uniref:Uncharacterized protein n=1 Tax=Wickerhamomyces mucosus TaxID=1378264 RepID=A0A9P8THS5_9ASCO|nr:hypothetical protein WICMUC_001115 [Wickerhamomyces mucosus]